MSATDVRRAAAELLHITLDRRHTLDEAMTLSETFDDLDGSDRGFARAIASTALRRLGQIDGQLGPLLSRPLEAATPAIRALLRAGVTQLWLMGTPSHAAVGETVEAAKWWPDARSGGAFLNAVLRRASEITPDFDALPPTSIWPDHLAKRFIESLGIERATKLAIAQLSEPDLDLTPKSDTDALVALTGGTPLPGGSVRLSSGQVESLPGFEDGEWWVQDVAAALPARILAPQASHQVLDLCAAPGGKTLQLASTGAPVTAVDRSKNRLYRLKENLNRTKLHANVVTANVETWRPETPADRILLDAPCSALGTLRRHPEGAWIKREADLERFPDIQARLLAAALDMLKPDGELVYCVCTPLREEGLDVINAAIENAACTRKPITPAEAVGFEDCITLDGDAITVPGDFAHDAFFISRLVKNT
ncbi:MAG: RsmB/NOP family class I SAM-dependent RNA methyltransferase [Hyphomonas sp.]